MARVLALLAAVLLVAAAVLVRRELDDGDPDVRADAPEEALVVACVPELEAACAELDGVDLRVEAPSATLAARQEVDAWVTFDPWPAIAEPPVAPVEAVATARLVLVTRAGACEDWTCPGAAVPATEAFGLVALGNASLRWSEAVRPGSPFARQELDLPEYRSWLGGLERDVRDPLADMLQLGPAGPPAAASHDVDVAERVIGSREEANLSTVETGRVGVVVAGRAAGDVGDRLGQVLARRGWHPAGPSEGVPSAALLRAMEEVLG